MTSSRRGTAMHKNMQKPAASATNRGLALIWVMCPRLVWKRTGFFASGGASLVPLTRLQRFCPICQRMSKNFSFQPFHEYKARFEHTLGHDQFPGPVRWRILTGNPQICYNPMGYSVILPKSIAWPASTIIDLKYDAASQQWFGK